jgi:hypothetical protein
MEAVSYLFFIALLFYCKWAVQIMVIKVFRLIMSDMKEAFELGRDRGLFSFEFK